MKATTNNLTLADWEKAVGASASAWKGRCFEIACLGVDKGLVKGTPVYGHYRGPVAPNSFFKENELGIQRHGWIRTPGGLLIDPTRWVFTDTAPEIYSVRATATKDYDEGGNTVRAMIRFPCPGMRCGKGGNWDKVVEPLVSTTTRNVLMGLIGDNLGFTQARVYWLANHSPEELGMKACREFFKALQSMGYRTAVPIDNWRRIMEEPQ